MHKAWRMGTRVRFYDWVFEQYYIRRSCCHTPISKAIDLECVQIPLHNFSFVSFHLNWILAYGAFIYLSRILWTQSSITYYVIFPFLCLCDCVCMCEFIRFQNVLIHWLLFVPHKTRIIHNNRINLFKSSHFIVIFV